MKNSFSENINNIHQYNIPLYDKDTIKNIISNMNLSEDVINDLSSSSSIIINYNDLSNGHITVSYDYSFNNTSNYSSDYNDSCYSSDYNISNYSSNSQETRSLITMAMIINNKGLKLVKNNLYPFQYHPEDSNYIIIDGINVNKNRVEFIDVYETPPVSNADA